MKTSKTIYEERLVELATERCGANPTTAELMEWLIAEGVIDPTRSKALVIRDYIAHLISLGHTKTDAMQIAADRYCCSYECVRHYEYYYGSRRGAKSPFGPSDNPLGGNNKCESTTKIERENE